MLSLGFELTPPGWKPGILTDGPPNFFYFLLLFPAICFSTIKIAVFESYGGYLDLVVTTGNQNSLKSTWLTQGLTPSLMAELQPQGSAAEFRP